MPRLGPTIAAAPFRTLLVWLHIISSVGWMSQAVTLATLLGISVASAPGEVKIATAATAELLDTTVLVLSANMSALSGFLLAATTTWGYFQFWWVAVKFTITLSQLFLGIFVLSTNMPAVVEAARHGGDGPVLMVAIGGVLMAGALGFQAWVSVAKPWGKTPLARRTSVRPSLAPGWLLAAAVAALIADVGIGIAFLSVTAPVPAFGLIALTAALIVRGRRNRRARQRAGTPAIIARSSTIADDVVEIALRRKNKKAWPAWTPGAHIDLMLPSGAMRQYSLCGDPDDSSTYTIAVLKEPEGRGGSIEIHALNAGDEVRVAGPRNHFELADASAYLFVAGGIGITPLLPMIARAYAEEKPWTLLYRGRSLATMPYAAELVERYPDRVRLLPADTHERPDLVSWLRTLPAGAAAYTCGPNALMDAVVAAGEAVGVAVHREQFQAVAKDLPPARPFDLELQYSKKTVEVPAAVTALDAMRSVLPDLPASCETGICGSCKVGVLAGRPEHRDDILTGASRERTDVFYPCVSRSLDPRLVVDA